jgi:hypothetical protein
MNLLEMAQLAFDDVIRHPLHGLGDVREKPGLLALVKQIEQRSGLDVIIVALAVIVTVCIAGNLQWQFRKIRTLDRTPERVRLVIGIRVRAYGCLSTSFSRLERDARRRGAFSLY